MPHVGNRVRHFLVFTCCVAAALPVFDVHPGSVRAAAPATRSVATSTPLPRRGDRSLAVVRLQQLLIDAGVHVPGGADGAFGPATSGAVAAFQRAKALPSSGVVDQATAVAMGLVRARPLVARGATGAQVSAVQRRLMTAGLHLRGGADGQFGPSTERAVQAFQTAHRIPVTGAVDAYTAALLAHLPTRPAPSSTAEPLPSPGDVGAAVRGLQRRLIAVGARPAGGADGRYGPATMAAVATFQRWMGLADDGVLDQATQRALVRATGTASSPRVRLDHFPLPRTCSFWDTYGAPRAGGRRHEGTDVFAVLGTPVYAVADGRITRLRHDFPGSRGGNQFWLTAKDGTRYFYGHLSRFADGVGVGMPVRAGDVIGAAGRTGLTSVVHLHFEVHPGGRGPVNPYPILLRSAGCNGG